MSDLIILGASTRAAATSAWRAGWKPWCVDLFADADLERIATVRKVAPEKYPDGLLDAIMDAPQGPVIYTGALENRPDLIARIDRPLLGNPPDVLRAIRSPEQWTQCLRERDIPCPHIANEPVTGSDWLIKPRKSAAGIGIRAYDGQAFNARTHFLQQRIDGEPCSAVYRAKNGEATLLGVTQQLIGTRWLNADGYQYAGNMGPIFPTGDALSRWRALGAALAATFHLRGLFGVDAIMREGVPWPVEINPRYTASVEVIERCWRGAAMEPPDGKTPMARNIERLVSGTGIPWGKAILFARQTFNFPGNGPWLEALKDSVNLDETEYADIPHAGEIVEQGRPVLTIFASGKTMEDCRRGLQEKAQDLDRRWWG